MQNNQKVTATVIGKDAAGNVVPVPGNVNWSNSNNSIVSAAPNGVDDVLTGLGPIGTTTVGVQVSGSFPTMTDSKTLEVTAGPIASVEIVFGTPVDQ